MSDAEYIGWNMHFGEYPPGDFITHRMLAELIHTVEALVAGEKARSIAQIAPFLSLSEGNAGAEKGDLKERLRRINKLREEHRKAGI